MGVWGKRGRGTGNGDLGTRNVFKERGVHKERKDYRNVPSLGPFSEAQRVLTENTKRPVQLSAGKNITKTYMTNNTNYTHFQYGFTTMPPEA